MIRACPATEFNIILAIINDGAQAYRGVIPGDRLNDPYMSGQELQHEIASGVVFWGYEQEGELVGVMGMQDVQDVTLIRHAYVRTVCRRHGIGGSLLSHLRSLSRRPILIGTWKAASWAIDFYQKNGFRLVGEEEKVLLLRKYWSIPQRQIDTSVVLVDGAWKSSESSES